jgi:hypothetical protein
MRETNDIESLNLDDLDVEDLERRLELAPAAAPPCPYDCTICTLCPSDCPGLCWLVTKKG